MLVGEEETGAGGGGDKHRKETDVESTCHLAQNDREAGTSRIATARYFIKCKTASSVLMFEAHWNPGG